MSAEEFLALAQSDEPLHPDLADHLTKGALGPMIHHPLIIDLFPRPGLANARYAAALERVRAAERAGDWSTFVFAHERPYRAIAFMDRVLGRDSVGIVHRLIDTTRKVRNLAAEVWVDSENIHEHVEDWLDAIRDWVPGDELIFGNAQERAEFATLPDVIEVWRGDCDDGGISWSTKRSVGEWFARRFDASHNLLHGHVNKQNVFGYLTRRGEFEILAHPEDVTLTPVTKEKE